MQLNLICFRKRHLPAARRIAPPVAWTMGSSMPTLGQIPGLWNQIGADIDGVQIEEEYGRAMALSDDGLVLAVGGSQTICFSGPGNCTGIVRTFVRSSSTWVPRGADIPGLTDGDQFGFAVSLSADGNVLAVGVPRAESAGAGMSTNSGMVLVYLWNGSAWVPKGSSIVGLDGGARLGHAIDLSSDGNTVVVGVPQADFGFDDAGYVVVYKFDASSSLWNQIGPEVRGLNTGDLFGSSVAISADGTMFVAGAYTHVENGIEVGNARAFIFANDISSWIQRGFNVDGTFEYDEFGYAVDMSSDGNTIVVSARCADDSSCYGVVRVYEYNGANYIQRGPNVNGEAVGDKSGFSVALSNDGLTMAIGAPINRDAGPLAGHVRVYNWNGVSFDQLGPDIDGEGEDDKSGFSVACSSDCGIVAVGAPFNYIDFQFRGHARVFAFEDLSPTASPAPSMVPTISASPTSSPMPSTTPSNIPTLPPTQSPTLSPTRSPTSQPTESPSRSPTRLPTKSPTRQPTTSPTGSPNLVPTRQPTKSPTRTPTRLPTSATASPSEAPLDYILLLNKCFAITRKECKCQRFGYKRCLIVKSRRLCIRTQEFKDLGLDTESEKVIFRLRYKLRASRIQRRCINSLRKKK